MGSPSMAKADMFPLLQDFTFYFLKKVEERFKIYMDILEKSNDTSKPTSSAGEIVACAGSYVPLVGNVVSSAVKYGEAYISHKLNKKTALALSEIIYSQRNDDCKEKLRKSLIKAAYEIFSCYEKQFVQVTCKGCPTRAAQKLGFDAAQSFVYYLTQNEVNEINEELIIKSIVANSQNLLNRRDTLETINGKVWEIDKIYKKVGLYHNQICYKNKFTNSEKYGYRFKFSFESNECLDKEWQVDDLEVYQGQLINLNDFQDDYPKISVYIISKNPDEFAILDRQIKLEQYLQTITYLKIDLLEDIRIKHEESQNRIEVVCADLNSENKEQQKESNSDRQIKQEEILQTIHNIKNDLLENIKYTSAKQQETQGNIEEMHEDLKNEMRIYQEEAKKLREELAIALEFLINNLPKDPVSSNETELQEDNVFFVEADAQGENKNIRNNLVYRSLMNVAEIFFPILGEIRKCNQE